MEHTETAETRVPESSFSGINGAKKERKKLEKSSVSYLGPGCREFESRHSDQNRQFSVRKLAVLTSIEKSFSLFIAAQFLILNSMLHILLSPPHLGLSDTCPAHGQIPVHGSAAPSRQKYATAPQYGWTVQLPSNGVIPVCGSR